MNIRYLPLLLLLAALPGSAPGAAPALGEHAGSPLPSAGPQSAIGNLQSAIQRADWHFRETLPAIRDWETILARWEAETPAGERTPVFPVPANGDAAAWPNPFPRMLLPNDDVREALSLRASSGRIALEWRHPDGKSDRREVPAGEAVVGYKHPCGGGKDQWYHHYERRFDALSSFRPQPAPFALKLDAPLDLRPGANSLRLALRNVSERPLAVAARARLLLPSAGVAPPDTAGAAPTSTAGGAPEARAEAWLAPGAEEALSLPVTLPAPGGGLLLVSVEAAGERYWLPFFTHVEDVPAVLKGISQILSDSSDAAAAELARLRERAGKRPAAAGAGWRALFEEASALRDRLLLARIPFRELLFVKRKPYFSEQPYMDAHHLFNRPGGAIYRLAPVRPDGKVTPVVASLGEGIYRDVCLNWDASRFLFSFGNGSDHWDGGQSYHLYEACVDGTGLRQLTTGPKNDCEPFYLPDGRLGFTSDRPEQFVMCGGDRHVANLHVMNADGSGLQQLSYNSFNEFQPSVLPDGRILYSRWEYNERSVTSLHKLFTINPDGTQVAPYYGNATIRPNVTMFGRPVPGSRKVTALFTAHHGQTHGAIGLVDNALGVDGRGPITILTPNVPVTGEKAEDSRYGWYSDPVPLTETTYLCSFTPTVQPWVEWAWGIYVGDRHGNLALVTRDPAISCAEPVPVVPRRRPPVIPATTEPGKDATLLLMDVYRNLPGVARGEAKALRIIEDLPRKSVLTGGVILTSATGIYTVKRVLGTVPLEADGSANFLVPPDRNIYFEVLDGKGREIQRMRSVLCLKPGEKRSCLSCHESRTTATPTAPAAAALRPPDRIAPPAWGTEVLSFLRDVQPVLNTRCVSCHAFDREAGRVLLTDDLTDQFCVAYQELVPYLSVANAMRWDNPEDVNPRPPYTYGSKVSKLTQILEAGHHGVTLSPDEWQRLFAWTDANAVYYDRYECVYPERRIFHRARPAIEAVYRRRCASCHGDNGNRSDGRSDTYWMSLNRHDARLSRMLQAPLARAAGGWGRCDGTVFAGTNDPDYQALLAALTGVRDALAERPRADLLSLRGTDAERQAVALPAPPPPRPAAGADLPDGWVWLSDLKWQAARAGWTPNNDGLPRRDLDIEEHSLRLGGRPYRKGIGTHAPSEITYRLDGGFSRFAALVGGVESGGTVVFQVFGDGTLLYESGTLHGLREVKTVDVPLAGVRALKLVVTDAGDGYNCDEANWAGARLLRGK